jgi:protein-glutamine gamma-glutamyltransferase
VTAKPAQAAAILLAATPAIAAWSSLIDGFARRALPAAALAAVLAAPRSRRVAVGALLAWIVVAPPLAGVPCWPPWRVPALLLGGAQQFATVSVQPLGREPAALGTALLVAGAAWLAAAALVPRAAGFMLAVAPWVAALAFGPLDAAVWQGVAIVLAALLWRGAPARGALALSAVVALASLALAPRERWFQLPGSLGHVRPQFDGLSAEPTFGPLPDRRDGAPMLEIRAKQPFLWRMQALDAFAGDSWRIEPGSALLPQPAATPVSITVRVLGLRGALVASPGRIERVAARGRAGRVPGEAVVLKPVPAPGDVYRVRADVVRASAAELRRAPPPRDPRLREYTRLGWWHEPPDYARIGPFTVPIAAAFGEPGGFTVDTPLWSGRDPRNPAIAHTPYARVAALARRLAAGARTQWQVVARVQRFLLGGARFRYTTDVPRPGRHPLVDFLLRRRAGYCQHFAGAAALLLRLVGVPARVVAGFATGVRRGGRFDVRDLDVHDWIEVYFQGYGWVPFNPTPTGAPAAVGAWRDPLARPAASRRGAVPPAAAVAAGVAAAALALAFALRRRRADAGELLAGLLPGAGPASTLSELRDQLAERVGPRTAALATELERSRFAPGGPVSGTVSRGRLARALARDKSPWRAVLLVIGRTRR